MLEAIFFYAFAAFTLGGALLTVTLRNAVHAAASLVLSLAGVAGLFLLAHAEFLFAAQLILYAGGVVLLFLFVIMLVNLQQAQRERQYRAHWTVSLGAGVAGAAAWWWVLRRVNVGTDAIVPDALANRGNTESIATLLLSGYLVPFEVVSLLLLVAMVGAVILARREA